MTGNINKASLKTTLFLLAAIILWAGNSVIGKFATELIGPFSLSFYRWLIASIIICVFAAKPLFAARRQIKSHIGPLIILGIVGTGLFNTLLYLGLYHTSAINSGIILAILPIIISTLNYTFKIERTNSSQIFGLILSAMGVVWVITHGDLNQLLTMKINSGDLIILAAVFSWGLYSVLLRILRPKKIDSLAFLAVQFLIGLVFILPFYLYEILYGEATLWQAQTFLVLGYVGLFPSLIAYFCWQQGIARGGANRAGFLYPLITVFTALFAFIFLGETLVFTQIIGALLIFSGVALSLKKGGN